MQMEQKCLTDNASEKLHESHGESNEVHLHVNSSANGTLACKTL